jgi:hypothetical protein
VEVRAVVAKRGVEVCKQAEIDRQLKEAGLLQTIKSSLGREVANLDDLGVSAVRRSRTLALCLLNLGEDDAGPPREFETHHWGSVGSAHNGLRQTR